MRTYETTLDLTRIRRGSRIDLPGLLKHMEGHLGPEGWAKTAEMSLGQVYFLNLDKDRYVVVNYSFEKKA